ncbi:MAG: helicase-related protein [Alphaproteobacteria bacterium]|nr:helicase-related protein [Alphaproteobacteria bacterium]
MDRKSRTIDIIKSYNEFTKTNNEAKFMKDVCVFFDAEKNEDLSDSELNLLLFLANKVGVPHYFNMLKDKYNAAEISTDNLGMSAFSSFLNEASLKYNGKTLHKYQKQVIDFFNTDSKNRFLLTAPTSFGKTFTVYEIIKKMKNYSNILLIFPSISLLSENFIKIINDDYFKDFKVHTLSETEFNSDNKNIFIFTPERYLSFIDRNSTISFDFAFIDEMYKIDNGFMIDEKQSENERDVSYRIALEFVCNMTKDILLAGPYMHLPLKENETKKSLLAFAEKKEFKFLDFNDYEIVDKQYFNIKGKHSYCIGTENIVIGDIKKNEKIARLIKALSFSKENTIIYCSQRSKTEEYAKYLCDCEDTAKLFNKRCKEVSNHRYELFIKHIESVFGNDWIVLKSLKSRIGIHHGLIPKYIQKEIINLFNKGALVCLFSTTTITEGVNTTAKNIIITSDKKGLKPLKQFDAKNIAGRAGRFLEHYVGRVIDLNNKFEDIIDSPSATIEHKNYDINSIKNEVDYQITSKEFLSEEDLFKKKSLDRDIESLNIPDEIFNAFKTINPKDKITLFFRIKKALNSNTNHISMFIQSLTLNNMKKFDWDAFEYILLIIYPIINERKLKNLIDTKIGASGQYSLLTVLLSSYLRDGFMGMVNYNTKERKEPITTDQAIRKVADCIYNIFKYNLVKYLGIFDIFYRYQISEKKNVNIDEVSGLGILIKKLEHNALTDRARRLSDFGVPFKLVQFYDDDSNKEKLFDRYESIIDQEISSLVQ